MFTFENTTTLTCYESWIIYSFLLHDPYVLNRPEHRQIGNLSSIYPSFWESKHHQPMERHPEAKRIRKIQ